MKKQNILNSIVLAASMGLGLNAGAQARVSSVHSVSPSQYTFNMERVSNSATDCSVLSRLLTSYAANHCDSVNPGLYCSSILTQLKIENSLERQDSNPMNEFVRYYTVGWNTNLPAPATYSKRFDITYADSYGFSLRSLSVPNAFRFDGAMTSGELDVEQKLGLPQGYSVKTTSEGVFVQMKSKIRVCALENSRISLVGNADMNITTYHPVGNVAYDIVDSTYRNAAKIADRTDISDSQKNYLLGIAAGEALKKLNGVLGDQEEVDDIGLSLQAVIMDASSAHFNLFPQEIDSGLAVRLLDPGFVVPNAPLQILYRVN